MLQQHYCLEKLYIVIVGWLNNIVGKIVHKVSAQQHCTQLSIVHISRCNIDCRTMRMQSCNHAVTTLSAWLNNTRDNIPRGDQTVTEGNN